MATSFKPNPTNTRSLRDAFGQFASGVTVITTMTETGPIGITANSFSSLSLDPALVLWSPSIASRRFPAFERAQHFAIHVLSVEQETMCFGFAKPSFSFDDHDISYNAHNVPLINNCLARFECTQHAVHPGGDHMIIVGKVDEVEMRDGDALVFFGGKIRKLDDE